MDPFYLFLHQHAIVHSAEVGQTGGWSMADSIINGLTEEQMRASPGKGMNSIVWLLWHMARTEDVAMNILIAGLPQVLSEGDWIERLNLSRHDIGTSMNDEEVRGISEQIDIPTLLAYRNAVGRRTREIVRGLDMEELDEEVDSARAGKLLDDGVLVEGARRVAEFWGREKKATLLSLPATGHPFMHLAEALTMRRLVTR
ncbi:MAG TPA: DinB family protein [Chloroflexia bacterium]|nr:DinB family protein [Chloroflexia bacterium]